MTLSARDTSARNNSPPIQGRGRGWGLSARHLEALHDHARAMRNRPTEPERRLWQGLRSRQSGGYKFRRQAVIGNAIADFLCPQKGLVIDVDGHTHTDPAADAMRTERLEALGLRVVRVTNLDVMQNLDGVLLSILTVLKAMPDRRSPHPTPSPEGEGLES